LVASKIKSPMWWEGHDSSESKVGDILEKISRTLIHKAKIQIYKARSIDFNGNTKYLDLGLQEVES
jgi:hypothetical protein